MSAPPPTTGSRWYRAEQRFVALAMAVMGVIVFLDVVHRVASRPMSWLAKGIVFAVLWGFSYGALRLRGASKSAASLAPPASVGASLGAAFALTAGLYAFLWAFLTFLPNGLVWSQTLGLVLMLWVGIVGASLATHERRHLALDLGSKLWPKRALPYVQAVGNALTAAFCLALGLLSAWSLKDHWKDWQDTQGAGGVFAALPIPKWAAFLALPTGFVAMAVRFALQAVDGARKGTVEEDDAMHLLGMRADGEPDTSERPGP